MEAVRAVARTEAQPVASPDLRRPSGAVFVAPSTGRQHISIRDVTHEDAPDVPGGGGWDRLGGQALDKPLDHDANNIARPGRSRVTCGPGWSQQRFDSAAGDMTRGKNATAAAGRRYQAEHDKQIDTYQRKVAELVAENKKLTGTIDRERESHRETVRKLTAQVQEGVSPELMALRAELADLRDKRAGERAAADVENRRVGKFYENAVDYMKANHGMSKVEAIEWVMRMMGEETVIDIGGAAKKYGISPERALALQKARGQR